LTTWWQLKKGGGHLVRRAVLVEFVCSPAKGYVAVPIRLPTGELTGYIRITEVTLPKEFHLSNVVTFSQEDGIKKAPHFAGLSLIYLLMPEPGLELSADWCQMNTPTGRSISSLFDPFGGECEQKRRSNH
jgi:hypothetical protein